MMQLASSPEHSLLIGSDSQFTAVGIRDRAHQFVIGLPAVERTLDVALELGRVDVVQQMQTAPQVIQLPECLLRSILSHKSDLRRREPPRGRYGRCARVSAIQSRSYRSAL